MTLSHPLVFIRHGQTDWNVETRMQGQKDIPLNARGREQAKRNGRVLADWLASTDMKPEDFSFVTSPLSRTIDTMKLIRDAMGLPKEGFTLDTRLIEITFGEWEGYTLDELAKQDEEAVTRRAKDKWNMVPPGGESYAMLEERVVPWIKSLQGPTVAVSHGGVSRIVRGYLMRLEQHETPILDVPQDKIFVWHEGQGWWV
jgi:broad specificity phosphatase PhoE